MQIDNLLGENPILNPIGSASRSLKSLSYSQQDAILASGGKDQKIILWDVEKKNNQQHFQGIQSRQIRFLSLLIAKQSLLVVRINQLDCGMQVKVLYHRKDILFIQHVQSFHQMGSFFLPQEGMAKLEFGVFKIKNVLVYQKNIQVTQRPVILFSSKNY